MEIVFQEKKNGERQLELWLGEERVCVCTKVTNKQAIANMVAMSTAFDLMERVIKADDKMKLWMADRNRK